MSNNTELNELEQLARLFDCEATLAVVSWKAAEYEAALQLAAEAGFNALPTEPQIADSLRRQRNKRSR